MSSPKSCPKCKKYCCVCPPPEPVSQQQWPPEGQEVDTSGMTVHQKREINKACDAANETIPYPEVEKKPVRRWEGEPCESWRCADCGFEKSLPSLTCPCHPPFPNAESAQREIRKKYGQDAVNHPSHYNDGNIEVIEFIEDKKLGFHLGNAVKYIARAGKKDPSKEVEDLEKAIWYIRRRLELFENHPRRPNDMKEVARG